jgi:hypothetical protein
MARLGYVKAGQTAQPGEAAYGAFYGLRFTFIVFGIFTFATCQLALALDFGTNPWIGKTFLVVDVFSPPG